MNQQEANEIVKRMVADATKKAPPINHPGHYAYLTGSLETKIKWLLVLSKLKFKDFDERGDYKMPI